MAVQPPDRAEVEEALFELQQYLSDRIAPLMVADSIELLTRVPADLVVAQIDAWTSGQYRSGRAGVPVSDYLFHAVQKIHMLGDFKLLPVSVLDPYVAQLKQAVLAICPEEDRELLASNLARLDISVTGPARRRSTSCIASPACSPRPRSRPARRVGAHAGRRGRRSGAGERARPASAPDGVRAHGGRARRPRHLRRRRPQPAPSHAPAGPAGHARDRRRRVEAARPRPSRTSWSRRCWPPRPRAPPTARSSTTTWTGCGRWAVPRAPTRSSRRSARPFPAGRSTRPSLQTAAAGADHSAPAEAMRRMVTLAQDTGEAARRYRDLVHAAIRQVNEGVLTRAVTMFDVADQLAGASGRSRRRSIEAIRNSGHDHFDQERLRKLAETPGKHLALARVMSFFVKLRPDGLLDDLAQRGAPRPPPPPGHAAGGPRHRRAGRGDPRLEAAAKDREQADPFFLRNLVYLLRILPRPAEAPRAPDEVMLIGRTVRSTSPLAVVKEAISTLGKIEHEAAEDALLAYLRRFESMLESPRAGAHPREETEGLLERTVSSLARAGGGRSLKAVVDHGLRDAPELGNTKQRLAELGYRDLTPHPELVLRLLAALEAELPRGLVTLAGVIINKRKAENIHSLIERSARHPRGGGLGGVLGHRAALPERELRPGGVAGARDAGRGAAVAPAHHRGALGRPGGVRPAEPPPEPGRQPRHRHADAVRRRGPRRGHAGAGEGQAAQRAARRPARGRGRLSARPAVRSPGSSRS